MRGVKAPVIKDVVLVGAGHAHVSVLRSFGMRPVPGVRFTLISREVHTPYSGMLPGLVAGLYDFDDAHIDTAPLARFAGARNYQDEVEGIDVAGRRIICRERPAVPYDILSLNVGSTPNTRTVPGADRYAIPVKPIDGFRLRFAALVARTLQSRGRASIVLVGAGAGGVELLLATERRLRNEVVAAGHDAAGLSFTLVSGAPDILPNFPPAFRARFETLLTQRNIRVIRGAAVVCVEQGRLLLDRHAPITADEILWTTEGAAAPWLQTTGLPLDDRGFLRVDEFLRVVERDDVFAAGDVISYPSRPLPKSGVYAVREGPVVADNIRRTLNSSPLRRYLPQRRALYLISTGERCAVGTRNGFTFQGNWVWRWKDWIDRRFMRRFNELPEMPGAEAAASTADPKAHDHHLAAMRCGGCGAKVGATVLSRAIHSIDPVRRPDIVVGLDAPDDAAVVDTGGDRLSVQTVDYFRAIADDPYTFGRIAANHSLGDIYAMGGEPQSALAIATMPYGVEAKVEADLTAMMIGANEVLRAAGCALVGGHTSEGAELALGFAVNGLVSRAAMLRKSGPKPGDVLILTKSIGTGTLLAADMRGKAKARWVFAAIKHMLQSNAAAAAILQRHHAHAGTDVTGFGLVGHLHEMLRGSDVEAKIAIGSVPVLEGARDTAARGIVSSLQSQNLHLEVSIRNRDAVRAHPVYPLLFDPQTAGGLLAAVPPREAARCVNELRKAGYAHATAVGTIAPRAVGQAPIVIETGQGTAQRSRAAALCVPRTPSALIS